MHRQPNPGWAILHGEEFIRGLTAWHNFLLDLSNLCSERPGQTQDAGGCEKGPGGWLAQSLDPMVWVCHPTAVMPGLGQAPFWLGFSMFTLVTGQHLQRESYRSDFQEAGWGCSLLSRLRFPGPDPALFFSNTSAACSKFPMLLWSFPRRSAGPLENRDLQSPSHSMYTWTRGANGPQCTQATWIFACPQGEKFVKEVISQGKKPKLKPWRAIMTLCLGSPTRFSIFGLWSSLLLDLTNSQHQALLQREMTLDTLDIIFSIYLLTPRKIMIRGRTNLWKFHTYWSSQHLSNCCVGLSSLPQALCHPVQPIPSSYLHLLWSCHPRPLSPHTLPDSGQAALSSLSGEAQTWGPTNQTQRATADLELCPNGALSILSVTTPREGGFLASLGGLATVSWW